MGTLVRYTDRKGGEAVEYSNHELVREIKSGDQSALELLVRRWYPRIYGYVFKLTGHEQDAYDLTQDVFIAMMQSIGSYTPWRKFDSWLFTIAHNKCMDYFRLRRKVVQAEDTVFDRPESAASLEDIAELSASVKAALEKAGCTGDMTAPEICDAIVGVMTSLSVDGLTGKAMTWNAEGEVSKAPLAAVIENGQYVMK